MSDLVSLEKNQNNIKAVNNSTAQVSASNTSNSTAQPVSIFNGSSEVNNNTNNNTTTSTKTIDKVYKQIEELCADYRISLEDAKKAKLLESIAGCTSEELVNMDDNDLELIINSLKFALKLDFKVWWKDRDINDIKDIAQCANEKFIREKTGGNWFIQKFKKILSKDNLTDELISKGYLDKNNKNNSEAIKHALKDYIQKDIIGDVTGLSKEQIAKKYAAALEEFGNLLNNYKNSNDKALLTSVIEELRSEDRALAAEVAIASGGGDETARAQIAKGINENTENIVTKRDALGNAPSKDDATKIANTAFKYMTKEDIEEAINVLNSNSKEFFEKYGDVINELKARRKNGESLTAEEEELLLKAENAYEARYAGAITGTCQNTTLNDETKSEVRTQILEGTEDAGITESVLKQVETYVEKNKDEFTPNERKELSNIVEEMSKKHSERQVEEQPQKESDTAPKSEVKTTAKEQTKSKEPELRQEKNSIETNVSEEVSKPIVQSTKAETSQHIQKTTDKNVDNNVTTAQEKQSNKNKSITEAIKEGSVKEFFKKNSVTKIITEVFDNRNFITSQAIINKTTKLYENLSADRQENILKRVNNTGLNELLHHTSDSTLVNIKDDTFSNFFATQQVKRAAEKAERKNYYA